MAIYPAAARRTSSVPGDSPPAWLTAQPCASLLRDSLHRHLGCMMREPEAGPATRRLQRYTTPIKLLPAAGHGRAQANDAHAWPPTPEYSCIAVLYRECPHMAYRAQLLLCCRAAPEVLPQRNLDQRSAETVGWPGYTGPGAAAGLGLRSRQA